MRSRITRRIFISSAEDSISPWLVGTVGDWFASSRRDDLINAATEIVRICRVPNWWSCDDGHAYIVNWVAAEERAASIKLDDSEALQHALQAALFDRNIGLSLAMFMKVVSRSDFLNVHLVHTLSPCVEQTQCFEAARLFDTWRRVAPILGRDSNVSGMLVYSLLGLPLACATPSEHLREEAVQLIARAREASSEPTELPAWANDGIHVRAAGPIDRRFAGVLSNFLAMCNAYDLYGRLDPTDPWPPELYPCDRD
jgi:hypothetical protein